MIGQVHLTKAEQKLVGRLVLDHAGSVRLEYQEVIANGELAATLIRSLIAHKATPECRLRYFVDPKYNASNSKSSKHSLFLRNAHTDEEMYRHPHFLKYLRYFIFGANLPDPIKEVFLARFKESDGDTRQLIQLARGQFRELAKAHSPQAYEYPEAFYQLAVMRIK